MGDNDKNFHFLNDQEFARLSAESKAQYLSLAAQELEVRQRKLREQMRQYANDHTPDKR